VRLPAPLQARLEAWATSHPEYGSLACAAAAVVRYGLDVLDWTGAQASAEGRGPYESLAQALFPPPLAERS
jgi:hypothetical protein